MDEEEEKYLEKIEEQLVDVTERLYDVERSFEGLSMIVTGEKRVLIQHGQDFRYQQGILDVVEDVGHYAKGEASLQEDTDTLKKVILSKIERGTKGEEEMGGLYQ